MEHKVAKLGSAVAAAVLGLGIPALASAQTLPQSDEQTNDTSLMSASMIEDANAPEMMPVSDAIASMSERTQTLADMGTISADDIAVVSLSDIGLTAEQRYTLMQNVDPSNAATLLQTLGTVTVAENGGTAGDSQSLADHLKMLGVDPAGVVAADVGSDGEVTIYYQ
ncbi:MAG TPA: hypothetical protein VGD01_11165 [Candidatus Elarobacter sp.]|jgi:hypothetical protein